MTAKTDEAADFSVDGSRHRHRDVPIVAAVADRPESACGYKQRLRRLHRGFRSSPESGH